MGSIGGCSSLSRPTGPSGASSPTSSSKCSRAERGAHDPVSGSNKNATASRRRPLPEDAFIIFVRYTVRVIYLFTGSDIARTRAKAFQWVAAARAKAPDAAYIRLTVDQLSREALEHALSSQGLFFSKTLVLLDDPFAEKEVGELILELLTTLKESANPIGIVAPKLLAARAKKLEAAAEKVFTVDAAPKRERGFNSGLVNALGARDGRALWKELMKAYREGDAAEQLHGLLHWKARDLMKKGSPAWTKQDARALSLALIELLSDSRGRDLELPLALERFALSLGAAK